jgi:hypothetical protein
MNSRNFLLVLLATAFLSAQLVEKPAAPANHSSKSASKAAPKPVKPKQARELDLLDQIKAPKTFRGALIDKATHQVAFLFRGTWQLSPRLAGSGSTIEWSGASANMADLDEQGNQAYLFGFNLGRREGKLYARSFNWPRTRGEEVVAKDEGSVTAQDGGYVIDLDKVQVLLLPSEKPWTPKEVHLYRFIASECSTPNTVTPRFDSSAMNRNSPRSITFAAGSYVALEDGPFGRIFFAPFGDANLHQIRYFRQGEDVLWETPKRVDGKNLKPEGFAWYSQLWMDGLTGFGNEAASYTTHIKFRFRKGTLLEEIQNESEQRPTYTGSLTGASEEIPLASEVKTEVLDRSRDASWAASGGPFSLQRTLLRAYQGCTIQAPAMSRNSWQGPNQTQYDMVGPKVYPSKLQVWQQQAQDAGAIFSPRAARPNAKTGPLGRVFPPGTTPEAAATAEKKPAKSLMSLFGK